jgi:hypothetical protein
LFFKTRPRASAFASFNYGEYVRQGGVRGWAKLLEESAYGTPIANASKKRET